MRKSFLFLFHFLFDICQNARVPRHYVPTTHVDDLEVTQDVMYDRYGGLQGQKNDVGFDRWIWIFFHGTLCATICHQVSLYVLGCSSHISYCTLGHVLVYPHISSQLRSGVPSAKKKKKRNFFHFL